MRNGVTTTRAAASAHLTVLLVLIAWATYLHVPLVSGGRLLVPSFPAVALSPLLLLAVRQNLSTSDVVFLFKIGFVLLLSIALSPGYSHIQEKLFALAQFVMALGIAVLVVQLMQVMSRASLERALLIVCALILIGCLLEMFDVIKAPSDAFRAWAYGQLQGIYHADARDLNMVGWPRPKLFSEEPSHVTKFFIASTNAWLLVRVSMGKAVTVVGATTIMLVIMGSPMLIVSGAITLSILIWNQRVRLGVRIATVMGILIVGGVVGSYIAAESYSNVADRVARIDESAVTDMDESSGESTERLGGDERRVVLPWVTLADIWRQWPFFGVGVGGKEFVAEYRNLSESNPTLVVGNNAFASIGIFLGIVGGTMFVLLVLAQARNSGVRRVGLLAVVVILFSHLIGGIDSIRYWGFVALLWGALAAGDRADSSVTQLTNSR